LREKAHNNTKRRNWTKYTSPCVLLGFTTWRHIRYSSTHFGLWIWMEVSVHFHISAALHPGIGPPIGRAWGSVWTLWKEWTSCVCRNSNPIAPSPDPILRTEQILFLKESGWNPILEVNIFQFYRFPCETIILEKKPQFLLFRYNRLPSKSANNSLRIS
jgi:hypothetical protein